LSLFKLTLLLDNNDNMKLKKVKWHKVTWYSKLSAVIFFIGILPIWTFYLGTQYELTMMVAENTYDDESVSVQLPIHHNDTDEGVADTVNYDNNTPNRIHDNFTVKFDEQSSLSGPQLAFKKDDITMKSDFIVGTTSLHARYISDNEVLVKEGPYQYGIRSKAQCGGCDRVAFNIYYFDFDKHISTLAYTLENGVYDVNDYTQVINVAFVISPNWKKITQYDGMVNKDQDGMTWTATDFCFNGESHLFVKCGTTKNVSLPAKNDFLLYEGTQAF
jgi:hypothetical protein